MSKEKITITSTVAANPTKVWDHWTLPEHIVKWNFASPDWHCPRAENDVRVGGKMKSRMEAKDGSFGFDFEAVYDEVINPQKISYSMPDGRKVETSFEESNGNTKVTTTFDAEETHPIEMQRGGWQAILENFRQYVEGSRA